MNARCRILFLPLLLAGCASVRTERTNDQPVRENVVRIGVMLKRMGDTPALSIRTNGSYRITGALGAWSLTAVSTNSTHLSLETRDAVRSRMLLSLLDQTRLDTPLQPVTTEGRSLPGLFGLHFLSPSLSAIYSGHENPYAGTRSVWLRFLLHLGIDALGTTAAASEGYRKDFRFNTGTFAFLLLHRLVTLPAVVVETDLYNRTLRAGYKLRF